MNIVNLKCPICCAPIHIYKYTPDIVYAIENRQIIKIGESRPYAAFKLVCASEKTHKLDDDQDEYQRMYNDVDKFF